MQEKVRDRRFRLTFWPTLGILRLMSRIVKGSAGYVYIMVSSALSTSDTPILKIGASTEDPNTRAKQLTASTSSPTPFHCAYARRVSNCTAVERAMHDAFDAQRVHSRREFFAVSLHSAILELDRLANSSAPLGVSLSFAELFASFPDDGTARELTADEQLQCRQLEASR